MAGFLSCSHGITEPAVARYQKSRWWTSRFVWLSGVRARGDPEPGAGSRIPPGRIAHPSGIGCCARDIHDNGCIVPWVTPSSRIVPGRGPSMSVCGSGVVFVFP